MRKNTVICAGLCAALFLTGCKSSESAYKQAYLKAKQQEEIQQQQAAADAQSAETNVVVPLQEKAAVNTQVVDNADNVTVRQEAVSVVNGAGLKNFSVVVGSFVGKANAEAEQERLKAAGYESQVVVNNAASPVMYRVIATTFENKADAVASRNALLAKYPGAWLLYAK